MGTTWSVYIADTQLPWSIPNGTKLLQTHLNNFENEFSHWRAQSELMRFNAAPLGQEYRVSKRFYKMIQTSHSVSEATDGAYDPTVAPLVDLWGFGAVSNSSNAAKNWKPPAQQKIKSALREVGWNKVQYLSNGSLVRTKQCVLNLAAIAKGAAVDAISKWLSEQNIRNYLVEIGGEVRTAGVKAEGAQWRIGIQRPSATPGQVIQSIGMPASGLAMATSGSYYNYHQYRGRTYSHTIDPRTGYPIQNKVRSVTVIAESAALADAYATALTVLGEVNGILLAEKLNLAVLYLVAVDV